MKLEPSLHQPMNVVTHSISFEMPIISGNFQAGDSYVLQPSLPATTTVRWLLLAWETLEEVPPLHCSLLDVSVHPGVVPLKASKTTRPLGKGGKNLCLGISKSSQENNSEVSSSSLQLYRFRLTPRGHMNNSMNQSLLIAIMYHVLQ